MTRDEQKTAVCRLLVQFYELAIEMGWSWDNELNRWRDGDGELVE
jgi:hypothetical protein